MRSNLAEYPRINQPLYFIRLISRVGSRHGVPHREVGRSFRWPPPIKATNKSFDADARIKQLAPVNFSLGEKYDN